VVWQDVFLTLCHGRRPIITLRDGDVLRPDQAPDAQFSYLESMQGIVHVCLKVATMEEDEPAAIDKALDLLGEMDSYCRFRSLPHLRSREHCKTLQQHFEYVALQINASFTVSVLCRPALKKSALLRDDPRHGLLVARAKESLVATTRAFLDFQALSHIPLRTWSFIHSALTATLLLCMWEETWSDPKCQVLQEQVVSVLQSAGSVAGARNPDGSPANNTNWLSGRHIRALVALQKALRGEQVVCPESIPPVPGRLSPGTPGQQIGVCEMYRGPLQVDASSGAQGSSALPYDGVDTAAYVLASPTDFLQLLFTSFADMIPSAQEDLYMYPWGLTNLSPMTYLDAIMSGR
jgi:hypothetical protein